MKNVYTEINKKSYYYLNYSVDLGIFPSTRERALKKLKNYRTEIFMAWKAWTIFRDLCPEEEITNKEIAEKIEYYKSCFYKTHHIIGIIEEGPENQGWKVDTNEYGTWTPYRCRAYAGL